jgi:hypothetical protein
MSSDDNPVSSPRSDRVDAWALSLTALLYLLLSLLTYDQIEEDAYIYFRFADNIAAGHGYVFNASGPRIESCSSVIWLALLVLLAKLPGELVTWTKFLGMAFGLASLFVTSRLSRLLISDRVARQRPLCCWH